MYDMLRFQRRRHGIRPVQHIRRGVPPLHGVILSLYYRTEIMHYTGTRDGQTPRPYDTCLAFRNLRKLVEGDKKPIYILKRPDIPRKHEGGIRSSFEVRSAM